MTAPHSVIEALREEIAVICKSFGQPDGKVRDTEALKTIATLSAAISMAHRCKVPVEPLDVLADALSASHAKDYAQPSDLESAFEAITETADVIRRNLDACDPALAVFQNLAALAGDIRRMADIVAPMVPPHLIHQLIAENQP